MPRKSKPSIVEMQNRILNALKIIFEIDKKNQGNKSINNPLIIVKNELKETVKRLAEYTKINPIIWDYLLQEIDQNNPVSWTTINDNYPADLYPGFELAIDKLLKLGVLKSKSLGSNDTTNITTNQ